MTSVTFANIPEPSPDLECMICLEPPSGQRMVGHSGTDWTHACHFDCQKENLSYTNRPASCPQCNRPIDNVVPFFYSNEEMAALRAQKFREQFIVPLANAWEALREVGPEALEASLWIVTAAGIAAASGGLLGAGACAVIASGASLAEALKTGAICGALSGALFSSGEISKEAVPGRRPMQIVREGVSNLFAKSKQFLSISVAAGAAAAGYLVPESALTVAQTLFGIAVANAID